jgi:hypothetical protein
VERLEKEFLLKLLEKAHLDGCNVFTVSWNGHFLAVGAIDGDRFISRLKMCLQFGQPHADEMKSWCIERLKGLASQLEVVQQSNKFIEQLLEDLLGAVFLFPLFQQLSGFIQLGEHRLKHDEETVKTRRHVLLHLVLQLLIQFHLLHVRDQLLRSINRVIHKRGLIVEEVDRSLLDAVHLARLLP